MSSFTSIGERTWNTLGLCEGGLTFILTKLANMETRYPWLFSFHRRQGNGLYELRSFMMHMIRMANIVLYHAESTRYVMLPLDHRLILSL